MTQVNVELYQVIHGMLVNSSLRPYCNEECSLIHEIRLKKNSIWGYVCWHRQTIASRQTKIDTIDSFYFFNGSKDTIVRPTLIRELLQFNTRNISNRKPFSCEIENLNLRLSKIWVICVTAAPSATLSLCLQSSSWLQVVWDGLRGAGRDPPPGVEGMLTWREHTAGGHVERAVTAGTGFYVTR